MLSVGDVAGLLLLPNENAEAMLDSSSSLLESSAKGISSSSADGGGGIVSRLAAAAAAATCSYRMLDNTIEVISSN